MLLVLLAVAPAAIHARAFGGRAFLSSNMQPEVVARTLRNVEDEWKAQAAVFLQCDPKAAKNSIALVDCSDAPVSFGKSCSIIAGAVIQGSGGDRNVAKEYMADVCSQSAIKGWHQQKCQGLALAVSGAMSADSYQNRYNFNSQNLCAGLWSRFLKEEGESMAAEKVSREASLKKAAEEDQIARDLEKKEAMEEIAQKKIELDARAKKQATKLKATKAQPTKPKAAPTPTAAKVVVAPAKAAPAVIVAKAVAPVKAVVAKPVPVAAPVKEAAVPKVAAPSVAKPLAAKAAAKAVAVKTAVSPKAF